MPKFFFSVVLLALNWRSYSQITVTSATFPVAGDTLRYAVDDRPMIDAQSVYTPPGIDQTWDLRQLQARVLLHPLTTELKVFPNPAHESLQLDFVPLVSGELHIAIHDVLGRKMKASLLPITRNQKMRWHLPSHDLPQGLYMLVLSTADRRETVPVVVQH